MNSIFSRTKHKSISLFGLTLFVLFVITFTYIACNDELVTKDTLEQRIITNRGGEYLSTEDALDLLGISCVPEESQGCNGIEYIDTMVVTLPAYPGCTFTIVFKHWECWAGTLMTDYTVGDFQIIHHNCSAFSTALNTAFTAGGTTFTTFVTSFESAIYNAIQTNIINSHVPVGSYPCLQGIFFHITFLRASCYKECLILFDNNTASLLKIACGSDCCEIHTTACRDAHGELVIDTYYAPSYPPSCENAPIFTGNPLLLKCTRTVDCSYRCPEL